MKGLLVQCDDLRRKIQAKIQERQDLKDNERCPLGSTGQSDGGKVSPQQAECRITALGSSLRWRSTLTRCSMFMRFLDPVVCAPF